MDFEKMKPFLNDFIQYYYNDLGNSTGGNLHVVLDDGNFGEQSIWFCQEECLKCKDNFGYFVATLLRYFSEEELTEMYESDFWGMDSSK